ncbi:hypothetical protein EV356DRAFT_531581 [Viridothelium virens]|uniref:Uncharacterized protein n=1 Tax=Viridothelium virens TaxID=1048519 RepID=A0A6A6HC99_VIRVR|nr:hypothetical protein EV356DRAFT_531581 [Viridothelium virens]
MVQNDSTGSNGDGNSSGTGVSSGSDDYLLENRNAQFNKLRRRSAVVRDENGDDGRGSGSFIRGALPPPAEHLPRSSTRAAAAGPSAAFQIRRQNAQAGSLLTQDPTYEVPVERKANDMPGTWHNEPSEAIELGERSPRLPKIQEEEEAEESVPHGTEEAELSSAESVDRADTSDPFETTALPDRPSTGASEAQVGATTQHHGPEQPNTPVRATPGLEEFDADDESSPP